MAVQQDAAQFTVERTYTVRRPKFTLFRNVRISRHQQKAAKGSHTIELGRFEAAAATVR